MSVKNPCRSHFTYSDRQSRPLYPSPANGSLRKRGSPTHPFHPFHPFHQANGDIHEREEREYVGRRKAMAALRLLFIVPPRRFMVAHDIHDRVGFGSAVCYMGWIDQLFGTSPSFFHCFNVSERTYSVPVVPTAVLLNH